MPGSGAPETLGSSLSSSPTCRRGGGPSSRPCGSPADISGSELGESRAPRRPLFWAPGFADPPGRDSSSGRSSELGHSLPSRVPLWPRAPCLRKASSRAPGSCRGGEGGDALGPGWGAASERQSHTPQAALVSSEFPGWSGRILELSPSLKLTIELLTPRTCFSLDAYGLVCVLLPLLCL